MVVPDAQLDERFADNQFVKEPLHVRFYAGAPLSTVEGNNIGTLCVYDAHAKELPAEKQHLLGILAKQVIHLMELELSMKMLNIKTEQISLQNNALMNIAFTQSHEFRRPLSNIMGVMNLIKGENYNSNREYMEILEQSVVELDEKVKMVVASTDIARNMVMS